MAYAPDSFLDFWLHITIAATKGIGFLLGVAVYSTDDIMTVNGFAMRIITQCTALHYIVILSTGILLYTVQPLSYRLTGLVVSTLFIIIANAVRLIITGVVGSISWDAFVIVHDYLWVAGFSLLVLGIWFIWAERRYNLSAETFRRGAIVLASCTAVYALLLWAMPLYGSGMAQLTAPLFQTLIGDPNADIMFSNPRMIYTYGGGSFSATFETDLMAVALYIGLFMSGWNFEKGAVKQALLGLVIMLTVSVTAITGGGVLNVFLGNSVAVVFLWIMHGLLLLLAILWWILRSATGQAKGHP